MSANVKETLTDLATKVAELYKELVTNSVKFDELRRYTKEGLDDFKHLLERLSDKIERIERERIRAETALQSKIDGLEARLTALSEQALHAAAREAAVSVMQQAYGGSSPDSVSGQLKPKQGALGSANLEASQEEFNQSIQRTSEDADR